MTKSNLKGIAKWQTTTHGFGPAASAAEFGLHIERTLGEIREELARRWA